MSCGERDKFIRASRQIAIDLFATHSRVVAGKNEIDWAGAECEIRVDGLGFVALSSVGDEHAVQGYANTVG